MAQVLGPAHSRHHAWPELAQSAGKLHALACAIAERLLAHLILHHLCDVFDRQALAALRYRLRHGARYTGSAIEPVHMPQRLQFTHSNCNCIVRTFPANGR
jgi:hypothetical protein